MSTRPRRGIVLAGGGARGAYEAGVLSYVFQELPQELLANSPVRVVCGTSVGAIHACYLAATAHIPGHNIHRLVDLWRSLRIDSMWRLGGRDLLRLPGELRALFKPSSKASGLLVNSRLLQDVVVGNVAWDSIRQNLKSGALDALAVSATHIVSGKTTVFVDRAEGGAPAWTRDPRVIARPVRIGPSHALASAAIPLLFPPIMIDGSYYSDGGVRQNTPLSPALRLGADRVLVIGLRHAADTGAPRLAQGEPYPSVVYLLGKLVDALMLDRVEYDLTRLEGFNQLLADGEAAFGETFIDRMSEHALKVRGQRYRHVDAVVVRPSRDLGEMALEFADTLRADLGAVQGYLFSLMSSSSAFGDADLLSYLLFDGRLASAMIELGRADAHAARSELIEFFRD